MARGTGSGYGERYKVQALDTARDTFLQYLGYSARYGGTRSTQYDEDTCKCACSRYDEGYTVG